MKINLLSASFVGRDKVAILNEPTEQMPSYVYTSNIQAFTGMSDAKVIKFKSSITKISTPTTTIRNLKLMFMFEPTIDELKQFHDILLKRFNVEMFKFDTLAQIGHELMQRYKCVSLQRLFNSVHLKSAFNQHLTNRNV